MLASSLCCRVVHALTTHVELAYLFIFHLVQIRIFVPKPRCTAWKYSCRIRQRLEEIADRLPSQAALMQRLRIVDQACTDTTALRHNPDAAAGFMRDTAHLAEPLWDAGNDADSNVDSDGEHGAGEETEDESGDEQEQGLWDGHHNEADGQLDAQAVAAAAPGPSVAAAAALAKPGSSNGRIPSVVLQHAPSSAVSASLGQAQAGSTAHAELTLPTGPAAAHTAPARPAGFEAPALPAPSPLHAFLLGSQGDEPYNTARDWVLKQHRMRPLSDPRVTRCLDLLAKGQPLSVAELDEAVVLSPPGPLCVLLLLTWRALTSMERFEQQAHAEGLLRRARQEGRLNSMVGWDCVLYAGVYCQLK